MTSKAAAIKPFKAHIPDGVPDDLRRRLAEAKWPDQLPGTTWEHGADVAAVRELAEYWQNEYDWRAQEARINRFEQFTTKIDGQQKHRVSTLPLVAASLYPGLVTS